MCGITGTGEKPESFYPVVEDFIGEGGSLERPVAIARDFPGVPAGSAADGYEALGGIRFSRVTLAPGERISYTILIGLTENRDEIAGLVEEIGRASCRERV